ncbi:MAG: RsmD family RNA methyltransferase, partial [Clostridia bacterium]|nr:RsmD family RNA methyltransferase [Clostridia bacterium]
MRIVAGSARSRTILTPPGRDTRPTLDRVRENLFNILQFDCPNARVLDLFAGSGALSMEALSRGAQSAVLADISTAAHKIQMQNARELG